MGIWQVPRVLTIRKLENCEDPILDRPVIWNWFCLKSIPAYGWHFFISSLIYLTMIALAFFLLWRHSDGSTIDFSSGGYAIHADPVKRYPFFTVSLYVRVDFSYLTGSHCLDGLKTCMTIVVFFYEFEISGSNIFYKALRYFYTFRWTDDWP